MSNLIPFPVERARLPDPDLLAFGQVACKLRGKRYHREGCKYFPREFVTLTELEAQQNGYSNCRLCCGEGVLVDPLSSVVWDF